MHFVKKEITSEKITRIIYFIHGEKVILDSDLAVLYEVETRVLKQAVRRNIERFPSDFLLQLTKKEWKELITNCDNLERYKYSPAAPFAFTEQGVAMLSGILNSPKAIKVNIEIMRAFVKLREILSTHKELAQKLKELELKMENYDEKIAVIFETIKELMAPPSAGKRKIGF